MLTNLNLIIHLIETRPIRRKNMWKSFKKYSEFVIQNVQ